MDTSCKGPCLKHCYNNLCTKSHLTILFAQIFIVYVIGCVLYLLLTWMLRIGTPFKDTLTTQQKQIQKKSAKLRGCIFTLSIFIGIMMLLVFKQIQPKVSKPQPAFAQSSFKNKHKENLKGHFPEEYSVTIAFY